MDFEFHLQSDACDQCHPNASNTHPETYPKFPKQIGKLVTLFEMLNWCIQNPLAADNPKMAALQLIVTTSGVALSLSRGGALNVGDEHRR